MWNKELQTSVFMFQGKQVFNERKNIMIQNQQNR